MEHSLLHALQLGGIVVTLGGAIFMLGFFFPALRSLAPECRDSLLARKLRASVQHWFLLGACLGLSAAILNFWVDVNEIQGLTIFGGSSLELVLQFATATSVGHLSLLRLAALMFTAGTAVVKGPARWWLGGLGALEAAICEGFICHAAAQPTGRTVGITVELIHILAASLWLGVLIHLLLARRAIETATDPASGALLAEMVRRFSPVAMTAVGLLGMSGLFLAIRYLSTPAAVPVTAYGLTLMVKLVMLVPLLYAGYVNYRYIRPGLQTLRTASVEAPRLALLRRFGRALELEVTAGVLVITLAGILASVSPPVGAADLRLTAAQEAGILSPHWPSVKVVNPATFIGADERTQADLNYADFTHNWSGVMVCLLGIGWLFVSLGGQTGRWAERVWPWLLVPFPFFVAVAADPEVWLLRTVTLKETVSDPQLLEHQLGALMAFSIVGLGWRDWRLPELKRPLGYALPVVMILGSLLLLGHAHSNFNTSQELTNMINVQHAVFGTFGLLAGVVRWLQMRGLFPDGIARPLWPSLVIGLGVFMAFFYCEIE